MTTTSVQHGMRLIPYHLLTGWEGNVRKTVSGEYIDQLANSIKTAGLLQPLVVSEDSGHIKVVAGRSRLRAYGKLVNAGFFTKDEEIPCVIQNPSVNSTEISLLENFMRLPLHPADQYEAFRDLANQGFSAAEIAARFGIADSRVLKLLKLGRLSPQVMQAYRDEKLDMEDIQAFAISDDHEEQNRVLAAIEARTFRANAWDIRNHFIKGEIPATDKRVKFVGLDFYELCGGAVRRDLFDDKNNGYIQDVALLDSCVEGKFQEIAAALKADGWSWVEAQLERDWRYVQSMEELSPEERELEPEQAAKLEALQRVYSQYEDGFDEDDEELSDHVSQLCAQIETIENSCREWTAEQKAVAGVLVSLEHSGEVSIEYGLVKPEATQSDQLDEEESSPSLKKVKPEFSAALLKDLTAYRTAALRIELAKNPGVALASVVYSLIISVTSEFSGKGNCLQIRGSDNVSFPKTEEPIASLAALDVKLEKAGIPEKREEIWDWCLARSQKELLNLLAICAAYTVNAVQQPDTYINNYTRDVKHSHQLAAALNLDIRTWFQPTAANFFSRVSKKQIISASIEATGKQPTESVLSMKKAGLAVWAEQNLGDKWMPAALRPVTIEAEPEDERGEEDEE